MAVCPGREEPRGGYVRYVALQGWSVVQSAVRACVCMHPECAADADAGRGVGGTGCKRTSDVGVVQTLAGLEVVLLAHDVVEAGAPEDVLVSCAAAVAAQPHAPCPSPSATKWVRTK